MAHIVLAQLRECKEHLDYYLKRKQAFKNPVPPIEKWIRIYSDRIEQFEQRAAELGLDTEAPLDHPEEEKGVSLDKPTEPETDPIV